MARLQEVGDLLFDVMLLAAACERHALHPVSLAAAAAAAAAKFRRRCPHVFGAAHAASRREAEALWQEAKRQERSPKGLDAGAHPVNASQRASCHLVGFGLSFGFSLVDPRLIWHYLHASSVII